MIPKKGHSVSFAFSLIGNEPRNQEGHHCTSLVLIIQSHGFFKSWLGFPSLPKKHGQEFL